MLPQALVKNEDRTLAEAGPVCLFHGPAWLLPRLWVLAKLRVMSRWKALLPRGPAVPARLWLAIVLEGVAILNLVFQKEIWSDSLRAPNLGQVAALLGAAVVGTEVIGLLWHWPVGYHGPWWVRLLFRGAIVGVVSGLMVVVAAIWAAVVVVISCYMFIYIKS